MRQAVTLKATTEAELNAECVALSLANPGKAITIVTAFGTAKAYINPSLSRIPVDTPDTREMLYTTQHIAWVDGKLVKPTAGWQKRQITHELRSHED